MRIKVLELLFLCAFLTAKVLSKNGNKENDTQNRSGDAEDKDSSRTDYYGAIKSQPSQVFGTAQVKKTKLLMAEANNPNLINAYAAIASKVISSFKFKKALQEILPTESRSSSKKDENKGLDTEIFRISKSKVSEEEDEEDLDVEEYDEDDDDEEEEEEIDDSDAKNTAEKVKPAVFPKSQRAKPKQHKPATGKREGKKRQKSRRWNRSRSKGKKNKTKLP